MCYNQLLGLNVDLDALSAESAAAAFVSKIDLKDFVANPETRVTPRQAQWFPMLLSPSALDGSYAGDVGMHYIYHCLSFLIPLTILY